MTLKETVGHAAYPLVLAMTLTAGLLSAAFDTDSKDKDKDIKTNPPAPPAKIVEQPPSISLSPAVMMVKAKPGQTFSQELTLWNNTSMELAFSLEARDVVVRDRTRVFVPAGELEGSIARNAVFSKQSVVVPPASSATTRVTVTLPQSPSPRAIVCIFMGKTKMDTRGTMAMTGSLGALVTFTLADDFHLTSQPMEVVVDTDAQSITFHQELKNTGTDPVVPKGVIAVMNQNGALVTRLPVPSQRMLPGESLEFKAERAGLFKAGKYRAVFLMENETSFISNATEFAIK